MPVWHHLFLQACNGKYLDNHSDSETEVLQRRKMPGIWVQDIGDGRGEEEGQCM